MQIDLTSEQKDIIRRAIETGRVRSPEAALRDALELWVERERLREELLAAIDEGEASLAEGSIEITPESMRALAEDIGRRGRARQAGKRQP